RIRDLIRVKYCHAVQVARGAADGLDEGALRTQESFLVRVEDRHQRHFGQVQAFAQQIDADEGVEFAETQIADDLDPLDRFHLRVQIAHLYAVFGEVVGQLLGHPLGERGYQRPSPARTAQSALAEPA